MTKQVSFALSSHTRRRPGPKGPSAELISAIVEMKRRNPRFGCPRIAREINHTFGIEIDKDVVRRVLARHHHPEPGNVVPHGSPLLGTRKTVCGALIYFAVNPLD